jgi:hypothetical protein
MSISFCGLYQVKAITVTQVKCGPVYTVMHNLSVSDSHVISGLRWILLIASEVKRRWMDLPNCFREPLQCFPGLAYKVDLTNLLGTPALLLHRTPDRQILKILGW